MKQEEKKESKREIIEGVTEGDSLQTLAGFECSITYTTIEDPFVIAEEGEGHSYEKEAVEQWFSKSGVSPMTGKELPQKRLLPNHDLKKAIQAFQKADIYWMPLGQHQQELNSLQQEVEGQVQASVPPKQETVAGKAKQLTVALNSVSSLLAVSQKMQQKPLVGSNRKRQKKKDDKSQAEQGSIGEVEAEIEKAFHCPLTRKLMKEPIIAADGYSYEKEAIAHYLKSSLTSPVTGEALADKRLVLNHSLRQAIEDFSQKKSHWITRSQHEQAIDKILQEAESRLQAFLSQEQALESPDSKQTRALALKKVSRIPLFEAVGNGQLGQVQWLLKNGASLAETDGAGRTVLLIAVWSGQLKTVQWLLKNGASLTETGVGGFTALLMAAWSGHLEIAQWLLKKGASLKERDKEGNTVLLLAADGGHLKTVQWLLKNGADITEKNNFGCTALLMAASQGQLETVQWLLKSGASLGEKGVDGSTALILAACGGHLETVQWLLKNGADITEKNNFGCTALLAATSKERIKTMQWLLKNGTSLKEKGDLGWTTLLTAAYGGQLKAVRWLLKNGATLEERNSQGTTALLMAVGGGRLEMVQWLVQNGANLKEKDNTDNTALLVAVCNGQLEMAQWLVQNGASVTEKDNFDDTALLWAAVHGRLEIVQWLLKNGASLTEKNKSGNTALLLAASHGQLGVVQWLLENGASLTEKNNEGCTALLLACDNDQQEMVKWLLKNGADPVEKNNRGDDSVTLTIKRVYCKIADEVGPDEARRLLTGMLKKESKHAQVSSSTTTNSAGSVSSSIEHKGNAALASNQSRASASHSQFFAPISAQQQILNERLQQQLEKVNKLLDTIYPAEDTAHAGSRAKYQPILQKYENPAQPLTEGDLKLLQQIQQRLEKEQAEVFTQSAGAMSHS